MARMVKMRNCWWVEKIVAKARASSFSDLSAVRGSAPGGGRELRVYPKPAAGNEGMSE